MQKLVGTLMFHPLLVLSFLLADIQTLRAQEAAPGAPPVHEAKIDANAFAWEPRPQWVEPEIALTQTLANKRSDPFYYILRDTEFLAGKSPATYIHQISTANEATALAHLGQIEIAFVPAWQQLRLNAVHLLRDGKVIDKKDSTQIRFLERELGLEQGIYTGQVTASLLVDDVRLGDALDIEYTTQGRNPVFPDRFSDYASWDLQIPTQIRRVVLKAPKSRSIQARTFGPPDLPEPKPDTRMDGDYNVSVYNGRDLAPMHITGDYPPDYSPGRWMEFSEYSNWNEVATWAAGLFKDAAADAAVSAVADKFRTETDSAARVVAALRYVQREIRYFSVSLGESSHRPNAPGSTLQRRFGDCKDKAALLIALLKSLDIQAQPVLVPSQSNQTFAHKLPSPDYFNHVIVRVVVGGKLYYLDPTIPEQSGRLDTIGSWHQGVEVLPATTDTQQPLRLPTLSSDLPQYAVAEKMTIPNFDDSIKLSVIATMRGQMADILRLALKKSTVEDRARELKSNMAKRYPGAEVLGEQKIIDDPNDNTISIGMDFQLPASTVEEKNGVRFVKFQPTPIFGHLALPEPDRKVGMQLTIQPQHYRYEFELDAPPSIAESRDPHTLSIGKRYFSLQQQSRFRGNVASEVIDLTVPDKIIEVKDLPDYASEMHRISEMHTTIVLSGKSGAKSSSGILGKLFGGDKHDGGNGGAPDPITERESESRESIKRITTSLDANNNMGDRDRSAALIQRGTAYDELGDHDKALADFDAAIKLVPKNPQAYVERAALLSSQGRHQEAIEGFSRAIALGFDDSGFAYTRRGIAEYFNDDRDAALDDFQRGANDNAATPYANLWLLMVSERFGKPASASILDAAKKDVAGGWPRPLYGLFTGSSNAAEIEKVLAAANPAERKLNSCEAYFYIGEYYLNKHDSANARLYFKKSIDTGVKFYTEFNNSKLELGKLDASITH